MRRFLVVGCGGSGGATLAYLMDQLRSDVSALGIDTLPRGWQFVHIDVPHAATGPDGLGTVEQQGGTYFGAAPQAADYADLDDSLGAPFAESASFDTITTWAPREPEKVSTPVAVGAGQYRAVGRMITLSRASAIRQMLQGVWDRFNHQDTLAEMRALRAPSLGEFEPGVPPIVLVVSSMAGGSGASMALDVCRLLTMVEGLDPRLIGVFLVAPDIFDGLPEASRTGVRPNALAMLGEIVAAQTGAARAHDVRVFRALGLVPGRGVDVPFARVFPVGRFAGIDRTQFGDGSAKAVYRGLGRGLAGLIMSPQATQQFVEFDLGNTGSPAGNRDLLGWGVTWEHLPWSSYGFASLSMGRDRYAEYSAQRIARACVDRLLRGHRQPGSTASASEQVASLLENQWDGFCRRAGLPPGEADIDEWFHGYLYPTDGVDREARAVVSEQVGPAVPFPDGVQADQWVPALRQRLGQRARDVADSADRIARRMTFDWMRERLIDMVEAEVTAAVAEVGLPYASAAAERLGRHLREVVAPGLEALAARPRPEVTAVPAHLEPALGRLRGTISGGGQLVEELLAGVREQVAGHVLAAAADVTAQVVRQFAVEVLAALATATGEAQRILETAERGPVTDVGLARLATDQVGAWPSDGDQRVPGRFDEADNEVLLTSSEHFQATFAENLCRAAQEGAPVVPRYPEAQILAARAVVSGWWPTEGGDRPPGGLLERARDWRTRVFPDDPRTGQPLLPSSARYDVHVRPAELLARARRYVARPGESFDRFCRLSITDFVQGAEASESELAGRRQTLVDKFVETLALARPLIGVDNEALRAVHRSDIEYRYKFSEVPFRALPIAQALVRVLQGNQMIDDASVQNLTEAIGDTEGVTRIDVFGSYPNYSPLVFDGVLAPVAQQWAEVGEMGRSAFWQWRRARSLPAALPMGDTERHAMVAGWLLGQIVGRLRIPPSPFTQAVQVWDGQSSRWESFPHPLLTPPQRFVAEYDWLPAVLESILLAVARSHQSPTMSSLRPYRLLRGVYDESPQEAAAGINVPNRSGRALLGRWLRGEVVGGAPSAVGGAADAGTVDERARLATEWLTAIRTLAGTHYMAPGEDGAPGGGVFSEITSRRQASQTPLFRDVAPDVHRVCTELIEMIELERTAAHSTRPEDRGPHPVPPADDDFVVPQAGRF